MKSLNLNLYDTLTMLVSGFLIITWYPKLCDCFEPLDMSEFMTYIICFIVGLIYHTLLSFFLSCLRNNKCMIKKAYKDVNGKEYTDCYDKLYDDYLKSYYRIMREQCLGNIPILEAHEAFLRDTFLLILLHVILLACDGFTCACVSAMILAVLVLYPVVWYIIQMKIFKLVWETDKYFDELEKDKIYPVKITDEPVSVKINK